ncbi:hypothetical protein A2801_00035 [Candidatus Woesebacteria bacterium RIFCSPHIGHO2_01_FULL_41_10]|uniref:Methylated-DNA-[protein]-cysteine S-methyltransferase DNA binding domain-containing protein n=1 Tax=Candidatus Woesebacteria bacterium RIFCSPHIGHO2_01_FULL_41_10 TaxID=1802500 RepID=A0A1F7YRG6_9BACT|nr:MAG: hypothetical protein A2801_00035 [Candidatus Woesebacteria bacterium RIFCSPHIGHO2_01_FULL_41_10]
MSQFKLNVIKVVRSIPRGKVASYGQIALYIGVPRAARQVGWILRGLKGEGMENVPWWRVVSNEGRISLKGNWNVTAEDQRRLLLAEGVRVSKDYTFDIEKYRFRPNDEFIRSLHLDEEYLNSVADKLAFSKHARK